MSTMSESTSPGASTASKKRSAFSVPMASSGNPPKKPNPPAAPRFKDPRDNLGAYILHPRAFPPTAVIKYDDGFVYVRDAFPKATVHTLLLPRNADKMRMHPFDAFEDAEFLGLVTDEAQKLKLLVAAELKRKFGEQGGRDWMKEVKVGVHAKPSMNHLHVHVISRDHHSERLKTGKHYNSFNTPFFVGLEEFPLPPNDERRRPHTGFTQRDLICWRCGKNFGNQCKQLKEHLAAEFEEWKREPEQEGSGAERQQPSAGVDEGEETD